MKTPELPDEDSPDLTDEEIGRAISTVNVDDLTQRITGDLGPGSQLGAHELRRRKPHLYWRARLRTPEGERTLIFLTDWLQGTP